MRDATKDLYRPWNHHGLGPIEPKNGLTGRLLSLFSCPKHHRSLRSVLFVFTLLLLTSFSGFAQNNLLYFISDNNNTLYTIDRTDGTVTLVGSTGRGAIEAIAYYPIQGSETLYAADAGDFGTLNLSTGTFTLIGEIDGGGTADGSAGAQTLNDVDGLMLDGQTLIMWAVERQSGSTPDLLFQIDLTTGQFVPDAFGAGVDYLEITGTGIDVDVDDLAVDPISGEIYGVSNNNGSGDALIRVNKSTGEFEFVVTLAQDDVEGLSFHNDGKLYGSEGDSDNRLSLINRSTGAMTNFFSFSPGGDVEGLAALVAPTNLISGQVFEDDDLDGINDPGETGIANVTIFLYLDQDGDGQVDPEDTRIQTTTTDVNGNYSFNYITTGTLLTRTEFSSYPAGFSLTTDNVETMTFTDGINFGESDTNNDFGLGTGSDCDGDGLTDFFEGTGDADGDGILNQCDLDSDNDGIRDDTEGTEDFDDDGIPNYLDRDSDDDGIPDAIEANGGIRPAEYVASQGNLSGPVGANGIVDTRETSAESGVMVAANPDSDGDTYRDYLDLDSDNDGILDLREAGGTVDSDSDGQVDGIVDANGNGYADALETSPLNVPNTDVFYENSNGLTQRPNYIDIDSDADGIDDTREGLSTIGYRFPELLGDNDGDGILDFWDISEAASPIVPVDTDVDGTPDYTDTNSDNDPESDFIEGNDADNNGVADETNTGLDANGNGLDDRFDTACSGVACSSDVSLPDTDVDGEYDFRDFEGVALDTDGDGVPDATDIDDDNDGILDVDESEVLDTDADGIPNSLDLDSDNDGIPDIIEAGGVDTDDDGRVDTATDTDGDGWANTFDSDNGGTALTNPDTDGDGLNNFLDLDSDGDGVVDLIESQATTGTPIIPTGSDSDGDGIDNAFDVTGGTPITPVDTESDGTPDYLDTDSDDDGFSDLLEAWDTDGDGIANVNPTGGDLDVDGLDNAFDDVTGPNNTTNVYNNEDALDFPDVTTSGLTSERDWREDNAVDSDGDGQINSVDIDDDDDGILDTTEGNGDFDNDGIINSLDLDSDNDGIPDIIEAGGVDSDDDGRVDDNTDTDNDGWADTFDSDNGGTALAEPDTDGDGRNNYVDVDSDGDGIVDLIESQATSGSPDVASGTDTDLDGLDNTFDTDNGGAPTNPVDTDTDSTPDYIDGNSDNDGFPDVLEGWDTDGDLTANVVPSGTDTDDDGLDDAFDDIVGPNSTTNASNNETAFSFPDVTTLGNSERDWRESNAADADFDGIPDATDIDDDNDGILDTDEGASTDTDGDGIVDRLDLDSDNDGIPDIIEAGGVDTNNDGRVDDDTDTDGDGWANTFDSNNGGVALIDPDTDNDGINNYRDLDSDNDGIEDIIEAGGVDTDDDGAVDSFVDSDDDGWANTFDSDNGGTVLTVPDTDADGLENYIDIDADGDGIVDLIESQATTGSPIIPVGTDTDNDGIDNAFDSDNGGTPITPVDTEADSTPDYIDFNSDDDSFSDALEGYDTDNDQVANTLPAGLDSDGDGLDDNYDLVVGPNATTNVYNNQDANDFPDVSTSGLTSERDWREANTLDADFDGVDDATDIDDDNDGILDIDEGTGDADGDGIPNNLDLDSDNDGIPDILEAGGVDNDNDGRVDTFVDGDGDGWANTFDSDNGGTALAEPDSDNDGVKNYRDRDSDNDGILDVTEVNNTDANGDGAVDGFIDTNGDGYDDNIEGGVLILPNSDLSYENTNGLTNLPNYIDIDSDADGIDDTREGYSTAGYQAPSTFTDADGDGILDFWDVNSGNSPIDPVDTDGAGLDDYVDTNSDDDSLSDFIEGNDFNEDGVADVANTGVDANGNGLDDAFDQDCYGLSLSSSATSYGEQQGTSVNISSSDLELVTDGGNQIVGIYFPNITIPQGETINSASIQFQVDEVTTGVVDLTIEGQLATNPVTFTTGTNNVSARTRTTADESWSPPNWSSTGESGADQRTVDISSIIQEIVNQGGWVNGNPLVIIITGPSDSDTRTAEVNPTLTINYGSGITFCSSNVALQDADLDGEKDFRDSNGIQAPSDKDGDGVPDVDDIDDDNDGILDVDEGDAQICYVTTVVSQTGVTDPNNIVGAPDGSFARIDTNGEIMVIDFGQEYPAGTEYRVTWRRTPGEDDTAIMILRESTAPASGFVDHPSPPEVSQNTFEEDVVTANVAFRYLQITKESTPSITDFDIDAIGVICGSPIDTDGDGIPNKEDIDADGDGIVDLIESQATTGTPVIPVGFDTDGDGLDDAFDGDCTPCGVVTGVPTVLEDTDSDGTDDYLDFNSDGDTFTDLLEGWDTDGNLVANIVPSGVDADNDGLDDAFDLVSGINSTTNVYNVQDANDFPDVTTQGNTERDWREENVADSDLDGIQDSNDIDDDNDGILDVDETGDTDGDGVIDSLDLDSDNDGIPDIIEAGGIDTNNDGRVDDATDTDNDGWADTFDNDNGGTALPEPDTDNDGIDDRVDLDSDNDGIEDIIEAGGGDTDDDGEVDSFTDLDGDGWANTFDADNGGTPLSNPDTDGDGLRNNLDIDSDGDGIVDLIESQTTTGTPVIPVGSDTDSDGIDNAFDTTVGTPTTPVDTDNDGIPDYLDFNSDGDSFTDAIEGYDTDGDFIADTTPAGTDSDNDGLDDNFDTVTGPNSTTNVYNNEDALDFPDVTTGGGTDQDWREANEIDTDADGVPDADDIDDDNDGILDINEGGCSQGTVVNLTSVGTGEYTVTANGQATISINGGDGGGGSANAGGSGATITGAVFNVTAGDVIRYVVGGGSAGSGANSAGGGGSTGLFINNTLVMVAGGGGGGDNSSGATGLGANTGTAGDAGTGTGPGAAGTAGGGGGATSDSGGAGGGGGINFAGTSATGGGGSAADLDPSNGVTLALGGTSSGGSTAGGSGFTGGGGGADGSWSGGGGGYSGGGGAGNGGGAGGGGSFLDTGNAAYVSGAITAGVDGGGGAVGAAGQDGFVTISLTCSGLDTDNDGIADQFDLDSDNDGIPDIIEAGGVDANNDGRVDTFVDGDGDGWANTFDSDNGGTALTDPDTDADELENRIDIDSDDDGIVDLIESQATTATPVIPVGSDLDEDGIDDAFDVDCNTCGGVTGVPTTIVNTDGTDNPDYIDTDSDNDGLADVIEAYDSDGDFTPNETPNGNDDDNDGLDDNFDNVTGPNSTTNPTNDQTSNTFPDVTTAGATSERDWRESNAENCQPGGINSNFLLWLRADDGGTSWRDVSNNYVSVSPVGSFTTGGNINFNPSNFFGGSSYYNTTLSVNADTYPDLAVIVVYQPTIDNSGAVWGEDNGSFDRYILDNNGAGENEAVSNGTGLTSNVTGLYSVGTTTISSVLFDEDQAAGSTVYINGSDTQTNFTSDHGGETSNTLQIGGLGDATNRFNGVVSEVIVYNSLLTNATDFQQIQSYLALKYGVTLSPDTDGDASTFEAGEGDYIASNGSTLFWDASDYQTYHNNVAGIARDDNSCLNQLVSQSENSDAIVAIGLDDDNDGLEASNFLNGSAFGADLSALMWGHDGAALYNEDNVEYNTLQVNGRLNREWRVRETNTVGTVTVRYDVSNLLGPSGVGTNDESQIVLLLDANGDFSENAQVISQSFVVADDGFVNFQVDFTDGFYFTLASTEQYSLPITLLTFEAESKDDHVLVEWTTLDETNNSLFRIERSANGLDFEAIGYQDGAGTSNSIMHYSFRDNSPLEPVNYYRLVDIDNNGVENISEIVRVDHQYDQIEPKLYPNPASRHEAVNLSIGQGALVGQVYLYQANGTPVPIRQEQRADRLVIYANRANSGLHFLQVEVNGIQYRMKLLIRD